MQCKCGSYAINNHLHGRDGSNPELCDVCYWRDRADKYSSALLRAANDFDDLGKGNLATIYRGLVKA